jgi:hypothetical protein
MASTTFAAPILPGKTDAWKAAVAEINGPRKQAYLEARRGLGITKEVASLQQTPHGDFAVVYVEAANISGIIQKMMDATDPFNTWFKDAVLKECHGMDASSPLPPDNQTMIDLF